MNKDKLQRPCHGLSWYCCCSGYSHLPSDGASLCDGLFDGMVQLLNGHRRRDELGEAQPKLLQKVVICKHLQQNQHCLA